MPEQAMQPLPPITPPKFILGSAPFAADGVNWLVHTEHPHYFARILPTEGGIRLDPYFPLPPESLDPQSVKDAITAGEAFYGELVRTLTEGSRG